MDAHSSALEAPVGEEGLRIDWKLLQYITSWVINAFVEFLESSKPPKFIVRAWKVQGYCLSSG